MITTILRWAGVVVASWCGIAVALAAGWSRLPRRRTVTVLVVDEDGWSGTAEDAAFAHMISDFATPELLSLLQHMDRRFGAVR